MKIRSLKTKFIFYGLIIHLTIWTLYFLLSSYNTNKVIYENIDKELERQVVYIRFSAQFFAMYYQQMGAANGPDPVVQGEKITTDLGIQDHNVIVWGQSGDIIYRSKGAPGFDLNRQQGFADETIMMNGNPTHWRVYTQQLNDFMWVTVGTDTASAKERAKEYWVAFLLPLIFIIPFTIASVIVFTNKGMRPLHHIADEVSSRNPTVLTPISESAVPFEIAPLVQSLNAFIVRLHEAIENEHKFTANAAHELQTPLAAIKMELQLAQKISSDPEVTEALKKIGLRVDRAVHTVRQMLTIARLESTGSQLQVRQLELHHLIADEIADIGHLAVANNLDIDFDVDPTFVTLGNDEGIRMLVRNLLTNALLYATEGTAITIRSVRSGGEVKLEIGNMSEPISSENRAKLQDSFYRAPGKKVQGAGLGLSIVNLIAKLHDIDISYRPLEADSGLLVSLSFSTSQVNTTS